MSEEYSKYVYGIDLGTTYSCIAYQDETGHPVVCKNMQGQNTTPSVVALLPGEEPLVGQQAKSNAAFDAEYTLSFIKRSIGRKDEKGNSIQLYYGEDESISPIKASSYILSKLARDAGEYRNDIVKKVVITCPAYFNSDQRAATKEAGTLAGLQVLEVIDEPTAAAICYGCTEAIEGKTILVYDLGGGTFDITVMRVEHGKFTILCSEGNHDLGGGNWDEAIYDYVENHFREETGAIEDFDIETYQDLQIKCEELKQRLSETTLGKIKLKTDEGKAQIELSRAVFNEITAPLLENTILLTKKAIAVAQGFGTSTDTFGARTEIDMDTIIAQFPQKYDKTKISEVLLVGGSTKMPQIRERVEQEFGVPVRSFEPDEAVAKGAAIYAAILNAEETESNDKTIDPQKSLGSDSAVPERIRNMLTDGKKNSDLIRTITNKAYGIQCLRSFSDGRPNEACVNNIIMRDSEIPVDFEEIYGIESDNQQAVLIRIFESSTRDEYYPIDQKNVLLEQTFPLPKGIRRGCDVKVRMQLAKDGILKISVEVMGIVNVLTQNIQSFESTNQIGV